jgi:hypothetical protein
LGSVRARLGATYRQQSNGSLNVTAVNTAFPAYLTPELFSHAFYLLIATHSAKP